ncbi:MAG: 23S rRNA pseudouridine synthase [Candidatus Peregrinibacteria bacterium Gr01-1014_25]|nr:MAG: 23S rRNA pseudouridine synthase [Candidatus Peregrinibacteria bacterium Gr01-1014_25]
MGRVPDRYEGSSLLYSIDMQERLQKILSQRGIASRRKAEEYIVRGLVKVNGAVATLGQKADPEHDSIEVDGTVLKERQEMLYYLMHKPVGAVTENISGGRERTAPLRQGFEGQPDSPTSPRLRGASGQRMSTTVRDLLPPALRGKVFPVGRLDKDSSGLLLFTNDGALAYRLTHPKFDHEKEYEVTVNKPITHGALEKLKKGMSILGEVTKTAHVERIHDKIFRIALTEGKNRQIRRMCEKVGLEVVSLKRIRIVSLIDTRLKPGQIRELKPQEIGLLKGSVKLT